MSGSAMQRVVVEPGKVKREASSTLEYLGDAERKSENLVNLVYPAQSGGWRDIVRAGWKPAFFNQQWGGAPILGGLDGDLTMDYATGYVENQNVMLYIGYSDAANSLGAQGFKVQQAITVQAVWLKFHKVGNPTGNFQVSIYSDTANNPNAAIANGAATAQAGTLHTQEVNGSTRGDEKSYECSSMVNIPSFLA